MEQYTQIPEGNNMIYVEKLKDPRWQRKRLEILQRDDWKCYWCKDDKTTLNVHHNGNI